MQTRSLVVAATLCAAWPALAAAQSSNLGSPAESGRRFSADYKAVVTAALPTVTADELAERVKAAVVEDAAERPLAIADARSWGALFGVDAPAGAVGDELVDGENASYLVAPDAGRLYIAWCAAAVTLPVLGGALFDRSGSYAATLLIAGGINIAGALVASRLPPSRRR